MKKLTILILLFFGLLGNAYGAEFLVQAKDHWMDELPKVAVNKMSETELDSYKARSQKGDIIVVRPDGWNWGKEESLPNYIVVKVPDIDYKKIEDIGGYESSVYEDVGTGILGDKKMLRKRKYSFSKEQVDIAKNAHLNKIQINKDVFDGYKTKKVGDKSEVIQPKTDLISYLKYKIEPYTRNLGKAYAASQLKKVVAPSGGDYTALETCMNANEQNLVTADKYFDVEISGDWSGGADTTRTVIHNYTTDATRYINIYTTGDAVHDGAWDDTAYRLKGNMGGNSEGLYVSDNYITFTGIQVWNTYGGGTFRGVNIADGTNHLIFDKCIFYASEGAALRNWNYTAAGYIRNSTLVNGTGSTARENAYMPIANLVFQNVIVVALLSTNYALGNTYNYSLTATNVYAHCPNGTAFYKRTNGTLNTSASSDGSDSTATVAYSTSSGAYFTNVTAGSEDFHITNTSSSLYQAGTDLSGTFTDDIDGDTRSAWDIGVDYIVGAATGRTRRFF